MLKVSFVIEGTFFPAKWKWIGCQTVQELVCVAPASADTTRWTGSKAKP